MRYMSDRWVHFRLQNWEAVCLDVVIVESLHMRSRELMEEVHERAFKEKARLGSLWNARGS